MIQFDPILFKSIIIHNIFMDINIWVYIWICDQISNVPVYFRPGEITVTAAGAIWNRMKWIKCICIWIAFYWTELNWNDVNQFKLN